MLLKKVVKVIKRKAKGLEMLQEKATKSQLVKLECNIMHRIGSGGGKFVDIQFISTFTACDFQ